MCRLLYFISEDWFFRSHFLARAVAARDVGYEVFVLANCTTEASRLEEFGINPIHLSFDRSSLNPWREARTFVEVRKAYRHIRPDLVHHIGFKPIVYGTLGARATGVRAILNAPVGMGYAFVADSWKARVLRRLAMAGYRLALSAQDSVVVVENREDREFFVQDHLAGPSNVRIVAGAGVDLERFHALPEPEAEEPLVVLPARMLFDKGVREFVAAAEQLLAEGVSARFVLVGAPDEKNPNSVPESQLRAWSARGVIEWWGWREDMARIFGQASVVCLPSYREGLPKALIEAAACGRAIVTTDVPGCRDVVEHGVNGMLVPHQSVAELADAIRVLLKNKALRQSMGAAGRQLAEAAFSEAQISDATLDIYEHLMVQRSSVLEGVS